MFCRAATAVLCAAGLLSFAGCRSGPATGAPGRLALLRFENLTSDPGLDWVSSGLPGTVASQLSGAREAVLANTAREVLSTQATQVLTGYFTSRNGRLQVTAHLRDIARNRTLSTLTSSGAGADVLKVANDLAARLTPNPRPFPTANVEAARNFWRSLEAGTPPGEAVQLLEAAVAADPGFGTAHLSRIQRASAAGDAQRAAAYIQEAQKHAANFPELERARLSLLAANAAGNPEARREALAKLVKIAPEDSSAWETMGQAELQGRRYREAVQALEKAAALRPGEPAILNLLAYARAFAGDLGGANAALDEYRKAAPADANAIDSRGDVHFMAGRFGDAEKFYLEAHGANPEMLQGGDLYRAAVARYFARDLAGADTHFARFLQYRQQKGDGLLALREALWEASTGRMDRAQARLGNYRSRTDLPQEARDLAAAQSVLFAVAEGKSRAATMTASANNAVRGLQFFAFFLNQPDAPPAEWEKRAKSINPQAIARQLLTYALLTHGHYAEAVPLAQTTFSSTSPTGDVDARVMLAWALHGSGQASEAARLLDSWPLPPRLPEPGLAFLTLSKLRELKS